MGAELPRLKHSRDRNSLNNNWFSSQWSINDQVKPKQEELVMIKNPLLRCSSFFKCKFLKLKTLISFYVHFVAQYKSILFSQSLELVTQEQNTYNYLGSLSYIWHSPYWQNHCMVCVGELETIIFLVKKGHSFRPFEISIWLFCFWTTWHPFY